MTIKELKNELNKYDDNRRVFLYDHGRGEELEIIGVYDDALYDDNDEVIEKIVSLYEY